MTSEKVPFGKQFRLKYFDFDPEYIPLNHGSFGAVPKPVTERRDFELKEYRRNPEKYLRFTIASELTKTLDGLAPYLGITTPETAKNVVFVQNATVGVNTVLRSLPFTAQDTIIYASTTYGACAKTILFLQELFGVKTKVVDIVYPMSDQQIVNGYKKAIDESLTQNVTTALGNLKTDGKSLTETSPPKIVAFFDSVSSQPGCKLPWKQLVSLCKEKNVLSFVDSAHGIGLLTDMDLENVRPDFLVTNLHKWFFVPAPAALLYVDKKFHKTVQTFPISHTYSSSKVDFTPGSDREKNRLRDKFLFIGTLDYTPLIASQDAIKFRKEVCGGEEKIKDYTFKLAGQAGELFAKEFGTDIMISGSSQKGGEDDIQTSMINVYLPSPSGPLDLEAPVNKNGKPPVDLEFAANELQYTLLFKYNVYFPIGVMNNKLYTRLSAQVYLDLDDFKTGIEAFKKEFAEYEKIYKP